MADLPEHALIGSLMLLTDRVSDVRALFDADDLDDPRCRVVLGLIDGLISSGITPDASTVFAAARTSGVMGDKLSRLGPFLVELVGSVAVPESAPLLAASVVEASTRRRIDNSATRLTQVAASGSLVALIETVTNECRALTTARSRLELQVQK